MDIQLSKLWIRREEYGPEKGTLRGTVEFAGKHGKIELPLDEETSRQIVGICADAIVRTSQQVATELTADVVNGVAALPSA